MTAQLHGPAVTPTPQEMRVSLRNDRSPRNVRACLPVTDHMAFDEQYREALRRAADELDLTPLHQCMESWRRLAIVKTDPGGYTQMMESAERIQHQVERGESTDGVVWDDAFTERLRARAAGG
ncbi:DUF6247 family protein [Streptosporangium sp. NBC_01756]|uniref:DUF6247 family protein n=1 Tax=Streptosporangium sp. NBC_01756 TaxID=2975950 RepID=UPI002DD89FE4|nr:DUF6247 family protein [Streptosporangium sp. NBC_01756]WSC83907.1 DUF6247 family protein [Streptosporangium sp. NBC_01756]